MENLVMETLKPVVSNCANKKHADFAEISCLRHEDGIISARFFLCKICGTVFSDQNIAEEQSILLKAVMAILQIKKEE